MGSGIGGDHRVVSHLSGQRFLFNTQSRLCVVLKQRARGKFILSVNTGKGFHELDEIPFWMVDPLVAEVTKLDTIPKLSHWRVIVSSLRRKCNAQDES